MFFLQYGIIEVYAFFVFFLMSYQFSISIEDHSGQV